MPEFLISIGEAERNPLYCAAYIAERLKSADGRADAMMHIVPVFISMGEVDRAAALADTVEDPLTRDRLLIAVAEKCAVLGDDDYGLQLADAIEDVSMQSTARERIALENIRKGEVAMAVEIADGIDHPDEILIAAAASVFGRDGIDAASALLSKMQLAYSRCVAFQSLAGVAYKGGDKPEAAELLERAASEAAEIDFDEERIRARLELAHNFVDIGRNDRAIAVLDQAKKDAEVLGNVGREGFLANIAVGFLRSGSLELADRTLDLVEDKTAIVSALSGFAAEFQAKGELAEAVGAANEAVAILRSQREKETRDHPTKFRQWRSLSVQLASLGETESALEAAGEIPDEGERMAALAQLAVVFSEGDKPEFVEMALSAIGEDVQRAFALVGVADAAIRQGNKAGARGRIGSALTLLPSIEQPVAKASLLTECVKRLIDIDEAASARESGLDCLKTVAEIRDESIRAACLAALAAVYESADFAVTDGESEVLRAVMARI